MWLNHNVLTKGTYTVTANGETTTSSTYVAGQLKVSVGKLSNGQKCEVVCVDANNNTYVFNVVCVKFIRTLEELSALGVGGYFNVEVEKEVWNEEKGAYETQKVIENHLLGNDSKLAGFDVDGYYVLANDIDCAGAIINSRIERVVYGAPDHKAGAFGTMINLTDYPLFKPQITSRILSNECSQILSSFFKNKR